MTLLGRVYGRFMRIKNALIHRKSVRLKLKTGIISFTFDDFPRSAYTVAGKILTSNGAQGTYYVAFGLMGQTYVSGDLFEEEDIKGLLHDGHELACHTYSHAGCDELSQSGLRDELTRNATAFAPYLTHGDHQFSFSNFSYPFGSVTSGAKQVAKHRFATARSIRPGINSGLVDLACLRANALYGDAASIEHMQKLIEQNEKEKGWLIFYTHDVSDTPSKYGCTPAFMENIVKAATSSNCKVLNVRNALGVLAVNM